ncbi:MAG TPA: hypothetical protein VJR89_31280, partial [Polyangiales bacterium]|nr:hypothetical protein [Polyangiales bacterium]
ARWLYAIVLSSVPPFAAHGASTSFTDAYLQNKFSLPLSAASVPPAAHVSNPWRNALWMVALVGVPIAALSFWWITRTWPAGGVAPTEFTLRLSLWSGVLAAVVMFARTGRLFLREVSVPAARRRFRGSVQAYVWQRHVIPQFIINAWFNGWVAPTMVNGPYADPSSSMSRMDIWLEAGMTGVLVALGIAAGTRSYLLFDLRWGVISRIATRTPNGLRFTGLLFAEAVGTWLLLGLVLFGLGIDRMGTWSLVVWRALWFGVIPAVSAYQTAMWTLSTAERAPAAATSDPAATTETASG